jgi:hypothetical protein
MVTKLRQLSQLSELRTLVSDIETSDLRSVAVARHLRAAIGTALASVGLTADEAKPLAEEAAALSRGLDARRQATFPINEYAVAGAVTTTLDRPFEKLTAYAGSVTEVDAELESLRSVFEAVLAVPEVQSAHEPLDCPVCETPAALTPARVAAMKEQVAEVRGLREAQTAARGEIETRATNARDAAARASSIVPAAATLTGDELDRREALAKGLIDTPELHRAAVHAARNLATASEAAQKATATLLEALEEAKKAVLLAKAVSNELVEVAALEAQEAMERLEGLRALWQTASNALLDPIRIAVDSRQGLEHWRGLTEIAADPRPLIDDLRDARARARVRQQLESHSHVRISGISSSTSKRSWEAGGPKAVSGGKVGRVAAGPRERSPHGIVPRVASHGAVSSYS